MTDEEASSGDETRETMSTATQVDFLAVVQEKLLTGEVIPNSKTSQKRAPIWSMYEELVEASSGKAIWAARCKDCRRLIQTPNSGTSSLQRHVQTNHRGTSSRVASISASDLKKAKLACVKMVALDIRPISSVEGEGLKELCQSMLSIGSKYGNIDVTSVLPSATTVRRTLMSTKKIADEILRQELQEAVADVGICITTDHWCSAVSKESYQTITATWIDKEFELQHRVLCQSRFDTAKTAEQVKAFTIAKCGEFGVTLTDDNVAICHDEGSDLIAAFAGQKTRIICHCHLLNTAVKRSCRPEALNESASTRPIQNLLEACHELVTFFRQSSTLQRLLEKSLKHYPDTRWSGIFFMLRSIYSQLEELHGHLTTMDVPEKLDFIDEDVLSDLIELLKPFHKVIDYLQGEYVTLSSVNRCLSSLKAGLLENDSDSRRLAAMKLLLLRELDRKIEDRVDGNLVDLAALLDPVMRFYLLEDLSSAEKLQLFRVADTYYSYLPGVPLQYAQPARDDNEDDGRRKRMRPGSWLIDEDDFVDPHQQSPSLTLRQELNAYMRTPVPAKTSPLSEPLAWWKENCALFPKLSRLARHILSIPASSAASERVFSVAGLTLTRLRSSLKHETVDALMSLNSRFHQGWECPEEG